MSWRDRLVDMVRGVEPVDPSMFRPLPVLDADRQVAVYAEAWKIRLGNALRTECPGLVGMLGDEADALFTAWLADHPPSSWTLDRIAVGLDDWLAARGEPARVVEMARLDRAVQAGFTAGEIPVVTPDVLERPSPPIGLQPHCTPLWLTTDVHRYRSALILGEPLPAIQAGQFPIAVWRVGRAMQHVDVAPGMYGILEALGRRVTVGAAVEASFSRGWVDPVTAPDDVREWFRAMVQHGMVGVYAP